MRKIQTGVNFVMRQVRTLANMAKSQTNLNLRLVEFSHVRVVVHTLEGKDMKVRGREVESRSGRLFSRTFTFHFFLNPVAFTKDMKVSLCAKSDFLSLSHDEHRSIVPE